MSYFLPAFEFILPHEGGLVDDPHDPGGITKYGISKRSYPDLDIANLSEADAREIYKRDYWDKQRYGEIYSQAVANKCLDMSVNMGFHQAHVLVQRACTECGLPLTDDGLFGPATVKAVNSIPDDELLQAIRGQAQDFYRKLAREKPSNERFLAGWLARANA